ncbi:unknown [Collinsella sp. CAG:289]|nr:unknown [Collinsella sp. CAG:289]
MGLVGQLTRCGEVGNHLAQIGVHALVDLIAQEQVHAEDVVGAKGLNGIGERMGLVHGLDVNEPVGASTLGMLVENRVDHVAIDVIGVAVLGKVDDVVAHQLVGLVIAQAIELRQVGAQRQQRCLATLDGGAVEPAHHDAHNQRCHQNGEVAAVEELGERGAKEESLERQEEHDKDPGEDLDLAVVMQVEEEQQRGAHHGDGDG